MLEIFAGGITAAIFYYIGYLSGRKNKITLLKEICSCTHASSFHDSKGCHKTKRTEVYDQYGNWSGYQEVECRCIRYVGPASSYVPELDGQ